MADAVDKTAASLGDEGHELRVGFPTSRFDSGEDEQPTPSELSSAAAGAPGESHLLFFVDSGSISLLSVVKTAFVRLGEKLEERVALSVFSALLMQAEGYGAADPAGERRSACDRSS